jgi:hypothetical protein
MFKKIIIFFNGGINLNFPEIFIFSSINYENYKTIKPIIFAGFVWGRKRLL